MNFNQRPIHHKIKMVVTRLTEIQSHKSGEERRC